VLDTVKTSLVNEENKVEFEIANTEVLTTAFTVELPVFTLTSVKKLFTVLLPTVKLVFDIGAE
jgi:hypothetical protein